jgi:Omp85 superfamily domain
MVSRVIDQRQTSFNTPLHQAVGFRYRCVMSKVITAAFAALVLLSASSVAAQQSRAGQIAAEQAEKSKRLTPNLPGRGERLLEFFEDYFTDPNMVFVTFGGIYPSGGFAPGIAWRRAAGHARYTIGGAYSVRNYKLVHGSVRFPELADNKVEVDLRGRWVDATQVPYYGLGSETIKDDRVNYGLRMTHVGGTVTYKPAWGFSIGGGSAFRMQEDREGAGTRPSIEEVHSSLSAPGLFNETTYTQSTAFTAIDWRESPGYSRRGGLYSIALTDYRDTDDIFSFRRIDANLIQLVPVLKEHWVFGVRATVHTTQADADQVIPYHLLPTLGGSNLHRGYPDFRFQDKHMMLLTAEYRWLPSRIIDMAIFVDSGKVAASRSDLDFNGLRTAYGIGIRFHGPNFTPLRIDVARGDEGFRLHVTGNVPF